MKMISKISGQQLKQDLNNTQIKEKNLKHKIHNKFDLIINNYSQYLSIEHKDFLIRTSIIDLLDNQKLNIIIQAEDNYVKLNGTQTEMFN